ncbi:aminotransferase class I/II-fold pyridoxal phosphate-dependent enzyme [Streptomonospora wellingtoniae]|uniref:Aminotransferase class I/II-fold pyridoxal phosphate-dependent enzyme n=1 Tax=Streptomonospora wellingtoniae TaxID=3075544 RepID=A0ABU2KMV4_9ACTN|nr:aminotransferase class I/II-fold pyridoxal phosphate-dependent enzyme [Streptomonospora sp. DSM 45055]MDT0300602.1 aminotransferase class I/II-fold pyridoxal phosphate-dependent enzyme [Streptomonospora sp. DSM 45055]
MARAAGELAGHAGTVLAFDASGDGDRRMVEAFRAAVDHFTDRAPHVHVVDEAPELRSFQRRAARALPLERLRRIYGFDAKTPLTVPLDAADMLGYFLFHPAGSDAPGVALVDALQAPHSAALRHCARAIGATPPVLLYRRLSPHLRRAGQRGSVREPSSVIFLDDSEETVRSKFATATTGGGASVAEHRAYGGDPVRCSAFATVELLCSPQRARTVLAQCRAGHVTCAQCKDHNADAVVAGLKSITDRLPTARAGVPAGVGPAVQRAVPTLHRPPPRACGDLEAAIATRTQVTAEQVVAANGSTEVVDWLFRLQARPGAQVVATEPGFELYRDLAQRHGFEYVPVSWDPATFAPDLDTVGQAIDERTRLVVVELPHSVSGAAVSLEAVTERLLPTLPAGARLLVDLAYADFTDTPPRIDADLLDDYPEVVAFGTLSKAHCLLGARVGYGLTAAPLATRLREQRLPYGIDALATAAAHAALADEQRVHRTLQANRTAGAPVSCS